MPAAQGEWPGARRALPGKERTGRGWGVGLLIAAVAVLGGCDEPPPPYSVRVDAFGDPRPGLTDEELGRFEAGRALFDRVFSPEEGVGPLFNENQCSACHTDPAPGGTGEQLVRKASVFTVEAECDPLARLGGENLRKQVTRHGLDAGLVPDSLPEQASHVGLFDVPFLFGLGGAELVTDETLSALSDPGDADGNGVSGVVGRTPDGRVGRFGRKADVATLREFTASALLNEMGLTSSAIPTERGVNGGSLPPESDPSPDPEVSDEVVDRMTDYVRFLGVPPRGTSVDPAVVSRGEEVFREIGCQACHIPSLPSGGGSGSVVLYSDLLLHDLGPGLAGSCTPAAPPAEYRTAPLTGLSAKRTFLHDGRARSIEAALGFHGGEASGARGSFEVLEAVSRQAVLEFLRTL